MDGTKMVKRLLLECDINTVELARRLNMYSQQLYAKYSRNNFSLNDMEKIAHVCGYEMEVIFTPIDKEQHKDDNIKSP